jgi:hypothetical protein
MMELLVCAVVGGCVGMVMHMLGAPLWAAVTVAIAVVWRIDFQKS